jgi:preprotein translocase subunit SecD
MNTYRLWSVVLIIVAVLVGWFLYASQTTASGFASRYPFKLGLDLAGGTELIYKADTSKIASGDVSGAMDSLKDVIERRVNLFGVSEPIIQSEGAGAFSKDNKLIVDLPGVTDIKQAIALIGQTPTLEFRLMKAGVTPTASSTVDEVFEPTALTGRYLSRATVEFNSQTNQPIVGLQFNAEGAELFAKITKANIGRVLAIFLDNQPISTPVIQSEITGGQAQISGTFTAEEARTLVRNLNYGALPVPIELVSTQTIGPSLGSSALNAGIKAGIWGFAIICLFLILWYRLPGFVASIALAFYVIISLAIFKLIPVTLTAAGLAGFILSIGMAVDANILIFERMKEECAAANSLPKPCMKASTAPGFPSAIQTFLASLPLLSCSGSAPLQSKASL